MGPILSHSEVEAILSSLDLHSTMPVETESPSVEKTMTDVTLYDFEHPAPLRQSQLETLRKAMLEISPSIQAGLSGVLHTSVAINFLGIEQSTYRDYLATAEQPCCLMVLKSDSATNVWLMDISRSIVFTMIDCMLGGTPSADDPMAANSRPFSDVETRLIDRMVQAILPRITAGLSPYDSLDQTRLVVDGSFLAESASNEAVVLVSLEIVCGAACGIMQLCIPWKRVAPSSQFAAQFVGGSRDDLRASACKIPVTVTAQISRLRLSAREFSRLKSGDILLTDSPTSGEISLEIDGQEIFRGVPGQSRQHKVIRLTVPATSTILEKRVEPDDPPFAVADSIPQQQ